MSSRGLLDFIVRLRRPSATDSDADLLDQFVSRAEGSAFSGLVSRHGPMVLSVCERRLGRGADAEDAFQAVFLALAVSARSIVRRHLLAGWLYRVAYLISIKAAGRRKRHWHAALPSAEMPMPNPLPAAWETDELKTIIDAEVAGLSIRLRAVVVLCLIEGRTNTEAAAVLGVPVGTIDSRLNTARKLLQSRLSRRDVAVGAGVTLMQMVGGPVEAAGPSLSDFVSHTVSAVLVEAVNPGTGAIPPAVAYLARRVTMTTKFRFLTALGITLGLIGGVGAGIYYASADDGSAKQASKSLDPESVPSSVAPRSAVATVQINKKTDAAPGEPETGTSALLELYGEDVAPDASISEVLDRIQSNTEMVVRVDLAAFRRVGVFGQNGGGAEADQFLKTIYETRAILPRHAGKLPMRDVLADALAQVNLSHPCTYRVRGSQLVIVPAYLPAGRPGADPLEPNSKNEQSVQSKILNEQTYGGVVSVSVNQRPLSEILADLRKQTGENILFDPRCEIPERAAALTVTLSDVRLYDALRVIADMAELKMVYVGNIYYVTTTANAKLFPSAAPQPPKISVPPPSPKIPQPLPMSESKE